MRISDWSSDVCSSDLRGQVDIDEDGAEIALMAEGDGLLDVREELQLVLDVFRGEEPAVIEAADVARPVDDLQMAPVVEEAGVAGVHPAVRRLGLRGGLRDRTSTRLNSSH